MENPEDNRPQSTERPVNKRPAVLTVVCLLSFAGSGAMFFSFMMAGLFHQTLIELSKIKEYQVPGMDLVVMTKPWVFLTGALAQCLSLSGVFLMWKMRKQGFHIYTLAQFGLLYLSSFYLMPGKFPTADILFSVSFVLLYATFLKMMK
jgi:hypothetical protein